MFQLRILLMNILCLFLVCACRKCNAYRDIRRWTTGLRSEKCVVRRFLRCAIHKLIVSIWNKEELPEEWKESIIVPIYKMGDKTDCNYYRGISLVPTTYTILSNILLSRLIPYAEEVTGDHQCGFRRNRSTTDHIFCIRQILEKKLEYNE